MRKPVLLFEQNFAARYDVTPYGEHFVMINDAVSAATQFHVVLNWFEELKARVPASRN